MRVYLDAGLLFTTLLETDGSAAANQILQATEAPFELTLLHQLQAENLITRLLTSKESARQNAGGKASRLWQRYTARGSFKSLSRIGRMRCVYPLPGRGVTPRNRRRHCSSCIPAWRC